MPLIIMKKNEQWKDCNKLEGCWQSRRGQDDEKPEQEGEGQGNHHRAICEVVLGQEEEIMVSGMVEKLGSVAGLCDRY